MVSCRVLYVFAVLISGVLSEFTSQPAPIQRADQGQDIKMTWKLNYSICDYLTNFDRPRYFEYSVTLQLSTFGQISSIYFRGYSCPLDDAFSVNSAYSTRASFNVVNDSFILFLTNIVPTDAGEYTLILFDLFSRNPQQRSTAVLLVNDRPDPLIVGTVPFGKQVNAFVPSRVRLMVVFRSNPVIDYTAWKFVDRIGVGWPLPTALITTDDQIQFILSSSRFYGTYTHFVNNSFDGSTQTKFTVLPPAKPEVPANFQSYFLTPTSIFLQWNCSWDNGLQQFFIVQLNEAANGTTIEIMNITSPTGCLSNVTIQVNFKNNIEPETNYEARLWSSNELGSSDVVRMTIITPTRPILTITSNDISFSGSNASIHYSIENGKVVQMKVECCPELMQVCVESDFNVTSGSGEVTLTNVPDDGNYVFHFYLYDGPQQSYSVVAFLKDIRISLTREKVTGASSDSLLPAVIVLAVLLCVALTLAVALGIVLFVQQRSKKSTPRSKPQNNYETQEGVANPAVADSEHEEGAVPAIYEDLTESRERHEEPKQITYETLRLDKNPKGRKKFQK